MTEEQSKLKAVERFCAVTGLQYTNLAPSDVSIKITDKNTPIGYADIVPCHKLIHEAYPLHIPSKRVVMLADKLLNPVIIWACKDGVVYAPVMNLRGKTMCVNKQSTMFFHKQRCMRFIYY